MTDIDVKIDDQGAGNRSVRMSMQASNVEDDVLFKFRGNISAVQRNKKSSKSSTAKATSMKTSC